MEYSDLQKDIKNSKSTTISIPVRLAIISFFIICMVYNSGYVLSTLADNNMGLYFLLITACPIVIISIKNDIFKSRLNLCSRVYLFFMILFACSIIANFSYLTTLSFLGPVLMLTIAFCLTFVLDFKTFSLWFVICMKTITIISLVAYILTVYAGIDLNLPVVTNTNGKSYYNGIIFFSLTSDIYRNTGLFWEPGLFASFLIIAVLFELYFKPGKISIINLVIFSFGIISTQSTAGFVLIPFAAVLLICRRIKSNNLWIAVATLLAAILIYIFYDNIIEYLLSLNSSVLIKLFDDSGSKFTRLNGPILNLEIFKLYPVFGAGFSNADKLFVQNMFTYGIGAQTSTSTYYLAAIGIFGTLYTFLWVYGMLKLQNIHIVAKLSMICIILIVINKEPHSSILFTYCFLFYMLKENHPAKSKSIYIDHNCEYSSSTEQGVLKNEVPDFVNK